MKKGHIFFISGVAGAGKGTVIMKLLEQKLENFELALSCKTREPREGEVLWVDYNKLSTQAFQEAIDRWEFLEYNFIHNQNYYGTRYKDVIENGIEQGKIILKEMDILALPKLIKSRPDLREDFSYIFLDLPIEKIKERMKARWDCTEWADYENRIDSANKESALKEIADFIINADQTQEQVFSEVLEIITKKI
jgi:guanylate kinase